MGRPLFSRSPALLGLCLLVAGVAALRKCEPEKSYVCIPDANYPPNECSSDTDCHVKRGSDFYCCLGPCWYVCRRHELV